MSGTAFPGEIAEGPAEETKFKTGGERTDGKGVECKADSRQTAESMPDSNSDRKSYSRMEPIKFLLVELGSLLGKNTLQLLNSSVSYLEVGHWMKAKRFATAKRVPGRWELFQQMAARVGARQVLYLEFGVSHGRSMRLWSSLLKNPSSLLHGFDSFEGLPEEWNPEAPPGTYSQKGKAPEINDSRVTFFKGLFEETLPQYIVPPHEKLIINIDCDLYSSTSFVLQTLAPHIAPGTLLYFDEFADRNNELRAFDGFLSSTRKEFELIGATKAFAQAAFECRKA